MPTSDFIFYTNSHALNFIENHFLLGHFKQVYNILVLNMIAITHDYPSSYEELS